MDININNRDTEVTVTFTPADYILVYDNEEWTLNHWIDMSYAGKCNQVGMPVLHLDDDDVVDIFKKAGFVYTEINYPPKEGEY